MIRKSLDLILFMTLLSLLLMIRVEVGGTGRLGDILSADSFIDDVGNLVEVHQPIESIISLSPAHTENIYSLGAETLLIGVDEGSNYPFETQSLPIYRLDKQVDQVAIIEAKPDMVLIDPALDQSNRALIARLESAGICVVALMPESLEDFGTYMTKLGMITGTATIAAELSYDFYKILEGYENEGIEGPLVYIEGSQRGHRTPTEESLVAQAIVYAGAQQMLPDLPWYKKTEDMVVSSETFMADVGVNAEYFISLHGDGYTGPEVASVRQQPIYKEMASLRDNNFYEIESPLISRYTMRYLSGVEELKRLFYGDQRTRTMAMPLDQQLTRAGMATILYEHLSLPTYVMNDKSYYAYEKFLHTYGSFDDVHWQDEDFDLIETTVMRGYIRANKSSHTYSFQREESITTEEIEAFLFIWKDARGESLRLYLEEQAIDFETIDTVGEFIELLEVMTDWS